MKQFHKVFWVYLSAVLLFTNVQSSHQHTFLVFGGKAGWIGQKIVATLTQQGYKAIAAQSRLENRQDIEQEISRVQPNFIINAAGVIGRPNVDWCEDHQQEVVRANIIGALNLVDIAYLRGIHVTVIGTGCVYDYDEEHPMYSGKGFREDEEPNFDRAWYCKTKIMLEKMLLVYPNMLYLRMRLPVSTDHNARNLITKLTRYAKVVNIPNSLTVLDDLLPLISYMSFKGLQGIYNFVNPGVISHNEILDLYKEHVDPNFKYENFTLAEQSKILKAGRCYNELDVTKLLSEFPGIPHVKGSMEKLCQNYTFGG